MGPLVFIVAIMVSKGQCHFDVTKYVQIKVPT